MAAEAFQTSPIHNRPIIRVPAQRPRRVPREEVQPALVGALFGDAIARELIHLPVYAIGVDKLSGEGHATPPSESNVWQCTRRAGAAIFRAPVNGCNPGGVGAHDCYNRQRVRSLPDRNKPPLTAAAKVAQRKIRSWAPESSHVPPNEERAGGVGQYVPGTEARASAALHAPDTH